MKRRSLLALAAMAPTLAAETARACSLAVDSPEMHAAKLPAVQRLFRDWWARDRLAFLAAFLPARDESVAPREEVIRALVEANEDRGQIRLFEQYFSDSERYKELLATTIVADEAFVACAEHARGGIGPDCSGLPMLHLFLVSLRGGRPHSLAHIKSEIFSGDGQALGWTG